VNIFSKLDYGHARDISQAIIKAYSEAEVDAVYIVYNEFKSVIQQRVVTEKVLPFIAENFRKPSRSSTTSVEQPPPEIFNRLLPRYVEIQVYRALLESAASSMAPGWLQWIRRPETPVK